jgi:hypothetical protein
MSLLMQSVSLVIAKMVLSVLSNQVGKSRRSEIGEPNERNVLEESLDSLVRICAAFPFLTEDVINLLQGNQSVSGAQNLTFFLFCCNSEIRPRGENSESHGELWQKVQNVFEEITKKVLIKT